MYVSQIGVTSWGMGCSSSSGLPGVYSDVRAANCFIRWAASVCGAVGSHVEDDDECGDFVRQETRSEGITASGIPVMNLMVPF
jgi:secreted trypsin-like serine protease